MKCSCSPNAKAFCMLVVELVLAFSVGVGVPELDDLEAFGSGFLAELLSELLLLMRLKHCNDTKTISYLHKGVLWSSGYSTLMPNIKGCWSNLKLKSHISSYLFEEVELPRAI